MKLSENGVCESAWIQPWLQASLLVFEISREGIAFYRFRYRPGNAGLRFYRQVLFRETADRWIYW